MRQKRCNDRGFRVVAGDLRGRWNLHGMQGVSGSSPLGSIRRIPSQPDFCFGRVFRYGSPCRHRAQIWAHCSPRLDGRRSARPLRRSQGLTSSPPAAPSGGATASRSRQLPMPSWPVSLAAMPPAVSALKLSGELYWRSVPPVPLPGHRIPRPDRHLPQPSSPSPRTGYTYYC